MPVTINTNIIRSVPQINDNGLVLAIVKYARQKTGTVEPKRINYQSELVDIFGVPTDGTPTVAQVKSARRELATLEYMISMGVNLIVLATSSIGTLSTTDLDKVANIEDFGYKIIIAPYNLQKHDYLETNLIDFVLDKDVELLLDIDPSLTKANILEAKADVKSAVLAKIGVSYTPKISMFVNMGLVSSLISAFSDVSYPMVDYITADADSVNYYGIPLSAIVAARKSALLISGTPWIPIAGESSGLVPEYFSLYRKFIQTDKNDIQSDDINLVISKTGIGSVIVAQNTLARVSSSDADKINPLIRGHVVTQALWIKRNIKVITESILFAPHLAKSYDSWQLRVEHMFENIAGGDGVTKYVVATGPKVMTPADVANNIFKGVVSYHPINVIESAVITLNILETEDAGVVIEGV